MRKQKVVRYITLFVLISSLVLNYYLYEENEGLKTSKGAEYRSTINSALFHLNNVGVDFWIERLQEEGGEVSLERHLSKLSGFSGELHRMNGNISVVGMAIDVMEKSYYELADRIRNGEDFQEQKEYIRVHRTFILESLKHIENQLGDSDGGVWYKKLHSADTQLSQDIWDRFKEFEEKHLLKKAG